MSLWPVFEHFAIQPTRKVFKNQPGNTVDGKNLAPVNMVDIPVISPSFTRCFYIPGAGFLPSTVWSGISMVFPCFFHLYGTKNTERLGKAAHKDSTKV